MIGLGGANGDGVRLTNGSSNTTVGGDTVAERNVISGNTGDGIEINGADNNAVVGNYIGTNASGLAAVPNALGIRIDNGAQDTTIGGSLASQRNVISGNAGDGITVDASTGTWITGNYIGTDETGLDELPNQSVGVRLNGDGVVLGTDVDGVDDATEGNVIAGNGNGVLDIPQIFVGGDNNRIAGNLVGLAADGDTHLANGREGIVVDTADNTVIGVSGVANSSIAERNVIVGANGYPAIEVNGGANTRIAGNHVGVNAAGTAIRGDSTIEGDLISLFDFNAAISNTIIGTNGDGVADALEGNLIAGGLWSVSTRLFNLSLIHI